MRPATGWMAYETSTPRASSSSASSRTRVLRLRDGEAVAGHDDDLLRVGELDRGVVEAERRAPMPPGPAASATVPSPPPKPPTMMFRIERFMASAMSLVRMAPEAPTRAPAMISTGLPMHEAGHCRGGARERVEQRDDDRHVGAADGQRPS